MRKHLIWMLGLVAALAFAGVAWATDSTGTDFSTLQMKMSPSKQSKTKFGKGSLFIDTSTLSNTNPGTPTNPGNVPKPTTNVKLTFPKDFKFTTTGLGQCKVSLENTTTQSAIQLCKSSKVGGGSATACISGGASGVPCTNKLAFVVTAFNGKPKGGKPTLILHSRNDANSLTTVLTGTLDQKKNTLNVPIPASVYQLATITDFKTTVGKNYSSKGKKYTYVSAKCSSKNWTLNGQFSYVNDPTDSVSVSQACQQK
jgi:hypothetical protein